MSSSNLTDADLAKLNDKDRAEIAQFLAHEQQRGRVQGQTHALTSLCWKKCIAPYSPSGSSSSSSSSTSSSTSSGIRGFFGGSRSAVGNDLDSTEKQCLANCVDRFMDANYATMKHLKTLQNQF
ncbi:hypothetical protein VTJ83DRAFT_1074 [Remersonia thermophila]|uniref:Mitochondrial import inner membrane translocase subunit n=1 Tax=Remersonia thermophila TaxID=72144 RepID=A0ABR4DN11_9PEZI